jgi:hypothetical protein
MKTEPHRSVGPILGIVAGVPQRLEPDCEYRIGNIFPSVWNPFYG